MNKKAFLFCILLAGLGFACSEDLNTVPTTEVSDADLYANTANAEIAMNGIYKILYTANSDVVGTEFNVQQCHGLATINMIADIMAEDYVQATAGNGWHNITYNYSWRTVTTAGSHGYLMWNLFYHVIYNANMMLSKLPDMEGTEVDKNRLKGQCLALRAYSYYYLTLFYQLTYVGNEEAPGVPLYLEPSTESKGRGTMKGVYDQIVADLDEASKLIPKSYKQPLKTNIDYYLVKAFQAKVYMTMEKFAEASAAAQEALERPGLTITNREDLTSGFNDVNMSGVMWGAFINSDDATGYGSFMGHLDTVQYYGQSSFKCLDHSLWSRIPKDDARHAWWGDAVNGSGTQHVQVKYRWKDASTNTADMIFLRAEDILLLQAEAECHLENYAKARELVSELMKERLSSPTSVNKILAARTDSKAYASDTHAASSTLMDEILFQRRVELWLEHGRLFDIKRLKLGFSRVYSGTNHPSGAQLKNVNTEAGSNEFMFLIPQYEFDGNTEMDANEDQNPEK